MKYHYYSPGKGQNHGDETISIIGMSDDRSTSKSVCLLVSKILSYLGTMNFFLIFSNMVSQPSDTEKPIRGCLLWKMQS